MTNRTLQKMKKTMLGFMAVAILLAVASCAQKADTIQVGILHSLSGTMSISEIDLKNVELMAIQEINDRGGLLGKKIEPVIEDGASDWPTFAEKAKKLIQGDHVKAVFGGWTSASRKAMLPVFEQYQSLLFYPVQYEGQESSPNIIYTGAVPNQQSEPALNWMIAQGHKKFFLLGSDYVYPRTANQLLKKQLESQGFTDVGEEYVPLGGVDFATIIQKIEASGADAVINTLNGDSNVAFFKQLKAKGLAVPTMSFSIAEVEVKSIGAGIMKGQYAAWNYFMTMDNPTNAAFVEKYKKAYGADKITDDPIEAAYIAVHLWAKAVEKAGSAEPDAVRKAIKGLSFEAPEGTVEVDMENNHLVKNFMVGKVNEKGLFDIVYTSDGMIAPKPY